MAGIDVYSGSCGIRRVNTLLQFDLNALLADQDEDRGFRWCPGCVGCGGGLPVSSASECFGFWTGLAG